MANYSHFFWSSELGMVAGVRIPDRFGHPAFMKLLKGLCGGSYKLQRLYIAEARESLRSRLRQRHTS